MFSSVRRRLTYANVTVTFALVFAMGGGAYAASKFLVTSTKQIKPSVLRQLQGRAGAKGAQGPAGPQGPAGAAGVKGEAGVAGALGKEGAAGKNGENGKEGSPWTAGGTLPSGKTLMGEWGFFQSVASGGAWGKGVSFALPLKEAPAVHYINVSGKEVGVAAGKATETTPTQCPGSTSAPTANPGNLCVYASEEEDLAEEGASQSVFKGAFHTEWAWPVAVESWGIEKGVVANTASKLGFGVIALAKEEGLLRVRGTWAVTAE